MTLWDIRWDFTSHPFPVTVERKQYYLRALTSTRVRRQNGPEEMAVHRNELSHVIRKLWGIVMYLTERRLLRRLNAEAELT